MHRLSASRLWALLLASSLALAACSSSASSGTHARKAPSNQRADTASFALQPGQQLNYILPLAPVASATVSNLNDFEYLMYRPLYWFGSGGKVGVNETESLARPASVKVSGTATTATIVMRHYKWSDGRPVTARDVEFWFNLLRANKANWWDYVAGQFPDNVKSFATEGPYRFTVTFRGRLSPEWIYNELAQLIPIPQHLWDRTSLSGKVGNYDLSAKGARAVYTFLAAQSKKVSAYDASPLWKVVDGPWKLQAIEPATGSATFVRNPSYSGPVHGSVTRLEVESFTSDSAEFNQLLAGRLAYGYVPFEDASQLKRLSAAGYRVSPWISWGITFIPLNFANPSLGPVFSQLYMRQAMQELIDQPQYIHTFLHGYGVPTYGPVPVAPKSAFVSRAELSDPYPFAPAAAAQGLRSHGWKVAPGGVDVCQRAGSGPGDCGPGVRAGTRLSVDLDAASGLQYVTEEVDQLKSALSRIGVQLNVRFAPFDTVVGDWAPCSKQGCWQMIYYGQGWYFEPSYNVPDGGAIFDSTGTSNGGHYVSREADGLIEAMRQGGIGQVHAYEDYLARQLPVLWMPQNDYQITAVAPSLRGATPQNPILNINPENWSLGR
jgi:peptide/nickel transport system substrate-binding protein